MASPALDRFLSITDHDEREQHLRIQTAQGRQIIMEEWSRDDRLKATDISALPFVYRNQVVQYVVGNPQKGLSGSGRSFYVKPNPSWTPPPSEEIPDEVADNMRREIRLENGSRSNKRQFVPIRMATAMPAAKGIQALELFGPFAESIRDRGRLVEISAREYATDTLGPTPPPTDEVATLKAELAALKKGRRGK